MNNNMAHDYFFFFFNLKTKDAQETSLVNGWAVVPVGWVTRNHCSRHVILAYTLLNTHVNIQTHTHKHGYGSS